MAEGDPVQFTKENECHVILNRGDIFYTPKNKNGYKCITHEFKLELNRQNSSRPRRRQVDLKDRRTVDPRQRQLMGNQEVVDIEDIFDNVIEGLNKAQVSINQIVSTSLD